MKIKQNNRTFFFAIPLQVIKIAKYNIDFSNKFGVCSLFCPKHLDDSSDYYTIKVYNYFTNDLPRVEQIENQELLFGEMIFLPFIPTRGDMKWVLIGSKDEIRRIDSFPDLKLSSLPTNIDPVKRNWFLLKNCGLKVEHPYSKMFTYSEVKHLEHGDEMAEITIKFRIYIEIFRRKLKEKKLKISIDEFKEFLLDILVKEPAIRKMKRSEIKETLIENFIYDFTDFWEL